MNQIALNTDLVTPVTDVMTRDAAIEYEMKLVSQAVEQGLLDQVSVRRAIASMFASNVISAFVAVALICC